MVDSDNLLYIAELLDDKSEVVARAVDNYLISQGEGVIDRLTALYHDEEDSGKKELILSKMQQINRYFRLKQLREYVSQSRDGSASLLEGAFLISSLLSPGITRSQFYDTFLPIIGEVMAETSEMKTGVENVKILNHIFYKRYNFRATDPFSLNDTDLLFVNVLEKKCGNPVAISIFYIIIAQACGIPVYPMCFTGGFITVYAENDKPLFYLNLFHEGEIFLENNVSDYIRLQNLPIDVKNMEIKKDATILLIYTELLDGLYSMAGNREKQEITEGALQCFGDDRFMSIEEDE